LVDLPCESLDNFEDGDEVAILDDCASVDGLVAVGAGDVLASVDLDEFLHAGSAAAVLVHAHHYGRVLAQVELSQAQEALPLHLSPQQRLQLLTQHCKLQLLHLLHLDNKLF
jgi:hypothetical protein